MARKTGNRRLEMIAQAVQSSPTTRWGSGMLSAEGLGSAEADPVPTPAPRPIIGDNCGIRR